MENREAQKSSKADVLTSSAEGEISQDVKNRKVFDFPLPEALACGPDPKAIANLQYVFPSDLKLSRADWDPMFEAQQDDQVGIGKDVYFDSMDYKTLKEVPCKFHDGVSGTCWKGNSCPYGHTVASTGAPREPLRACWLPHQLKGLLGMSLPVFISYVKNPWKFYVVPVKNWACSYCGNFDGRLAEQHHGIEDLYKMEDALTRDMLIRREQPNPEDFLFEDLVAVEVSNSEGASRWKRGIILHLKDEQVCGKNFYRIQLIDSGEKKVLHKRLLLPLPKKYTTAPKFAFRCRLYGVTPVVMKPKITSAETESILEQILNKMRFGQFTLDLVEIIPFDINIVELEYPTNDERRIGNVAKDLVEARIAVSLSDSDALSPPTCMVAPTANLLRRDHRIWPQNLV